MLTSDIRDQPTVRAVHLFAERLRLRYPDSQAWLFGSRARGDHHDESDADVAVVVQRLSGTRAEEAGALADIAYDVLLETGVLVSALPLTRSEMMEPGKLGNPALIEAIRRDGIAL